MAGVMAVLPPVVAFLKDPGYVVDWKLLKTTLVLYVVLIVIYLVIQALRTPWELDTEIAEELRTLRDAEVGRKGEIAELTQKYSDNRPRLGLNVHSVQGESNWRTSGVPVAITIQHLAGRIPTGIRFDPVPSNLGKFSLRFDALPHADPAPHQTAVSFEVQEIGVPQLSPKDWATTSQYQGELLRLFVHDSPPDLSEIRYDLVAHFKDGDDELVQTFHLVFDPYRFGFAGNTA
jgi:hypothetical protein